VLDGSGEYGDTLLLGYGNVDEGAIHEGVRILKTAASARENPGTA
jgi:hypothetical protein